MVNRDSLPQPTDVPNRRVPESKSIKLWWNPGSIGTGDVLRFLFGERSETIAAAKLLIDKMKQADTLSISRYQLRQFAVDLNAGTNGCKYSYHNFYTKLVRKLLDLGFVEKCMIWNPERRTTVRVYQLRLQQIPNRPPESGFVRQAWLVAKGWNDLVKAK